MQPLISVIVPIYNVEEYLDRCVDSIVKQTYKNLEIILVNDGSPDTCPKICDLWKKKDDRIRVIHKKNGGLSDARNKGIDIATGDYLTFIDSDDFIDNNYIKELYDLCVSYSCMCAIGNFTRVKTSEMQKNLSKKNVIEYLSYQEALSPRDNAWCVMGVTAWGKLFHKSLFEEIRFPVGRIHEDEATIYKVIYQSKNVVVTRKVIYYYYVANESICRSSFTEKRMDSLEALYEKYLFFCQKKEENLAQYALVEYLDRIIAWYILCEEMNGNIINFRKQLSWLFNKHYNKDKIYKISLFKKIKYNTFKVYPKLFLKINRV